MANRIGQQFGNYRLVRFLGRGGFAEVYLGEHIYLKNRAALKVLHTHLSEEDSQQFLAEAQTLAQLSHPHIVRVLDFGVEDGTAFLVTEYVPRGTLRHRHPSGSCLPLDTIASYVEQIASALLYAHEHKIIHRDVKPENILLKSGQNVLLSDFGISLLASSNKQGEVQEMAGTRPYMAPELFEGKPEFASDQYALGIMAYEWLCGKRPFHGNGLAIMYQQAHVPPLRLLNHDPSLPQVVEKVVLKALAKDPKQRYSSVQHFAQALGQACQRGQSNAAMSEVKRLFLSDRSLASVPLKRVFVSYAHPDEVFATRLAKDVRQQGMVVWQEPTPEAPEQSMQETDMRQALRAADVVLLVTSAATPSSPLVQQHLRLIGQYQRPLVCVSTAGATLSSFLPQDWPTTIPGDLIDARQQSYERVLTALLTLLEQDGEGEEPALLELVGEPRSPYKGLRSFTQADTTDFFGQDHLVEELVHQIKGMISGHQSSAQARLLVVIGPSGSGKSSVVRAGLLPKLQQGVASGSDRWIYLPPMVPGIHPLEALALTLAPHLPVDRRQRLREEILREAGSGLHELASQMIHKPDQKVVLFIDQFEEIFILTASESERQQFLKLLITAATEVRGPVMILLTLRADFYHRCMAYPRLHRLIEQHQKSVLPLEATDLRAVIRGPAALPDVQVAFEGNLVSELLFEVQEQAGALPLLQFTLEQLFLRRQGHLLTLRAYREIGGVRGALARHAEAVYAALPSEQHRLLARELFLRLVDPGLTDQDITRRRANRAELALLDPQQTIILNQTAEAFILARLLTTNEVADTSTIEVSHEALIHEWRRLGEWVHSVREDILLQQTISADAEEWQRRGRSVDQLYRGTVLAGAEVWARRLTASVREIEFLQASVAQRRQEEEREQIQRVREKMLERRSVSRLRFSVVALSVFSVITLILAIVAQVSFQQAEAQRVQANREAQIALREEHIAFSRALAQQANAALLNHHLDLALLLSVKASQEANTYEARDSLLTALDYNSTPPVTILRSNVGRIRTLAFTASDQSLLVAGDDSTIPQWWDITAKKSHTLSVGVPLQGELLAALSPDGKILASGGEQGLRLWDTKADKQLVQLDAENTLAIAFSQDGKLLASGSTMGTITLWDVATRTRIEQLATHNTRPVWRLTFSQDKRQLAIATCDSDYIWDSASLKSCLQLTGSIFVWDLTLDKRRGSPFAVDSAGVRSVTFSPDGKELATGTLNGSIVLRDSVTGQPIGQPLEGHSAEVRSVAFSPDGRLLASGSFDNTVRLWDTSTGRSIGQPLVGHTAEIRNVTFSPDGRLLASGSGDGTIILWNVISDTTTQLQNTSGLYLSGALSQDGELVAMGGDTLAVWDTTTGKRLQTLATSNGLSSLAFSSDRRLLASSNLDGLVTLWDLTTGKSVGMPIETSQSVWCGAFSPDGHLFATATREDGIITIWNLATRKPIKKLHQAQTARSLAFDPHGGFLASGNLDGSVNLWDLKTDKSTRMSLQNPIGDLWSIAFSPDGKELAIDNQTEDGGDIMISVWNVETSTPTELAYPFKDDHSELNVIMFTPEGQLLLLMLTSSFYTGPNMDTTYLIKRWDVRLSTWQHHACRIANRNLTHQEWQAHVQDEPYQKVCPDLPAA